MAEIVVHHLEKSRSHRILWLLAELGLEYTLKTYERHPETMRADPALREVHALGKAPIVVIDGVVMAESGAVIEALVDGPGGGKLKPTDAQSLAHYRYWMHYAEGSLMPPLLVRLIFDRIKKAPLPFFIKPIAKTLVTKVDEAYTDPELALHTEFMEAHLTEHAWFAGAAFSAADVQMSYPVQALLHRGGTKTPKLKGWLERVQARAGYQEAEAKGGPNVMPS
ncbi:MAG: glutathione S-transferase [Bradymonadia bacterium]